MLMFYIFSNEDKQNLYLMFMFYIFSNEDKQNLYLNLVMHAISVSSRTYFKVYDKNWDIILIKWSLVRTRVSNLEPSLGLRIGWVGYLLSENHKFRDLNLYSPTVKRHRRVVSGPEWLVQFITILINIYMGNI